MIIGHYTIRVFSLSRRTFTLLRHDLSKKTMELSYTYLFRKKIPRVNGDRIQFSVYSVVFESI